MVELDLQSLLTPITATEPCGPDTSNDFEFAEFLQQMRDPGDGITDAADAAADDPALWTQVVGRAERLLGKAKDVRVGVYLALALLKLDGLKGFATGLELLHGMVAKFPTELHPKRDPDDPYPIQQINALADLGGLRFRTVLYAAKYGAYTLRDLLIADGQLPAPVGGSAPVDLRAMALGFADLKERSAENAAALITTLKSITEHLGFLREYVQKQSGPEHRDDLAELATRMNRALEVAVGSPVASPRPQPELGAAAATHAAAPVPRDGEIRSHEDVIQALQRICQFYERHERISPVPLLLQRAMRLVPMSFLDVVGDLLPGQVSEIEKLAGVNAEKKT